MTKRIEYLELKNSQLGFAGIATSEQQKLLYAGHILDFCGLLVSVRSFTVFSSHPLRTHPILYKHNLHTVSASASGGRLGSSSSKESSLSVDMLQLFEESWSDQRFGYSQTQELRYDTTMLPWEDRKKVVQVLSRTLESHESDP